MVIPLDELRAWNGEAPRKTQRCFWWEFYRHSLWHLFKHDLSQSVGNYILDFERLYSRVTGNKRTLCLVTLCKCLHCASLDQKEQQMILAAAPDLKYATMCSTLRRAFGESHVKLADSGPALVKEESALTASEQAEEEIAFYSKRSGALTRGKWYGRPGSHRPYSLPHGRKSQKGRNTLDSNGRI